MTKLQLSSQWRARLEAKSRLVIGYSGGVDSSVLLHLLYQNFPSEKLLAIHFNHQVQAEANDWQTHCEQTCKAYGIELHVEPLSFSTMENFEARARKARLDFFQAMMSKQDALLLGHHSDDVVETFFLRLMRGAGVEGLASIEEDTILRSMTVYRPLSEHSKTELQAYAEAQSLSYIDDPSNSDERFQRNYVRKTLIPTFEREWPQARQMVLRCVDNMKEARAILQRFAKKDLSSVAPSTSRMKLDALEALVPERQIQALRHWLTHCTGETPSKAILQQIRANLIQARQDAQPKIEWAGLYLRRFKNTLYADDVNQEETRCSPEIWHHFPKPVFIDALKQCLCIEGSIPEVAAGRVSIRYRKGGESIYWKGHQRALKKLLQEWEVPPWQRDRIPLIYDQDTLVAVADFAISEAFAKDCTIFLAAL